MKKIALVAIALLVSAPAAAKDIDWKLTDVEQQQLMALLDLAAKQGGVQAANAVAYFANKLRNANQPESTVTPKPEMPKAESKP
jgi:hypothetical protein